LKRKREKINQSIQSNISSKTQIILPVHLQWNFWNRGCIQSLDERERKDERMRINK